MADDPNSKPPSRRRPGGENPSPVATRNDGSIGKGASDADQVGPSSLAGSLLPSVSLPKGGGALRGIGEKFSTSPATGTGSLSVPLATSPGRAGFALGLELRYDSGSGSGPFGIGWQLSTPSITRKTDKGLPRYADNDDSDVFVLSGAEDLVPVPYVTAAGAEQPEGSQTVNEITYNIRRYRPRIEGLFARIERWTAADGDTHWRVLTKDNVLNIYGKNPLARIADPQHVDRVFSWLIDETRDDRGNVARYTYAAENGAGVDAGDPSESSRFGNLPNDPAGFLAKAQRYLTNIQYGNRVPVLDRAAPLLQGPDDYMFEVVLDYGELDSPPPDTLANIENTAPEPVAKLDASGQAVAWPVRQDPYSSYRASFEVRTYRLCRRILMLHHFSALAETPFLVRSTDLAYDEGPITTYLIGITQAGYDRSPDGTGYVRSTLPPLTLGYDKPTVRDVLQSVDRASLEGIANGVDGSGAQWADLDGEGIPGVLIPKDQCWFYKTNLGAGRLAPPVLERTLPVPAELRAGRQQLSDLGGDGNLDLVSYGPPLAGYFSRTPAKLWEPFAALPSVPNIDWTDPNLRFVDIDGDGLPDVLITEHDALVWYHSRAKKGFDRASWVSKPKSELAGPAIVFADGTETIQLADMSGDGLVDIVRVRNGDVCYWPNLGYGNFGRRVTLDRSPRFDAPFQFDPKRVRLADIDGSGTNDVIYLGRDGARLYFNQSGNSLSDPTRLESLPPIDSASSLSVVDFLGQGTACLLWSSPRPGCRLQPLAFVDLMGSTKPHLLTSVVNNLGVETHIAYAPSTKFYLQDRTAGREWITRLSFPVHCVETVETFDYVSRNHFVTRYSYHHGYFDGVEREFRGFGRVDQLDTEEFAALAAGDSMPLGNNVDPASAVPPVLTKTWFHTGVYYDRDRVSNFFAGLLNATDPGEYYREPGLSEDQARALLLPDTILPGALGSDDAREACRALKGTMLRQEVYALDGGDKEQEPYTVTEQNVTIELVQPRGKNEHAIFLTHPREAIHYNYERDPSDPRIRHELTLEVDAFGNTLKAATVGYGRRQADPTLPLDVDRDMQTKSLVTYTETLVTNGVQTDAAYRGPMAAEGCTYELTGYTPTGQAGRLQISDLVQTDPNNIGRVTLIFDGELAYEDDAPSVAPISRQRRPIERARTLYRKNDLSAALPLGALESLGLSYESYKLTFTPGLLALVFQRPRDGQPPEDLLEDPATILAGPNATSGGYRLSQDFKTAGQFPPTDPDDHWWAPGGRLLLSPGTSDSTAQELAYAQQHFFLPLRHRDAFHTAAVSTERFVTRDGDDLLVVQTSDAVGNRVSATNDYRVLQPKVVTDANHNRTAIAFDALGMVVGTALMGKAVETLGDSLSGFEANLAKDVILQHLADPLNDPQAILLQATTRSIYDLFAYVRTSGTPHPQPGVVYTLARETHDADLAEGGQTKVQHAFSYSDGLGREIQKKAQAEPGPLAPGGAPAAPRWVGTGWIIFNNKGLPVRQYEPFFSATPTFEFAKTAGVSPVIFYDPVGRSIATMHPNQTYEKVVFGPWQHVTWDSNDTVLGDPRTDADVAPYVAEYFSTLPSTWQTWYQLRATGGAGPDEQDAAEKAAAHNKTPTAAHVDCLARPFLTLAHNGFNQDRTPILFPERDRLDIAGNRREVRDAIVQAGDAQGRAVMRYAYDMLANCIHQTSMEAGEHWMLNDVAGKSIRAWDSRGHTFRSEYDPLRRQVRSFVTAADPTNPTTEILTERLVYGEQHPDQTRNLRNRLYLHLDQAGAASSEAHDFKGNLLRGTRRLGQVYKQVVDWSGVDALLPTSATTTIDLGALQTALAPLLNVETFLSRSLFDAVNRPIQVVPPHSDQAGSKCNVVQPSYNEAKLLERIDVWLGLDAGPVALLDPAANPPAAVGVGNVDYDAKGRRTQIEYKNGAVTTYTYDPQTFRLARLYTRRGASFVGDCDNLEPPPPTVVAPDVAPGGVTCGLQNLQFTYDPAGNITEIRDTAQPTIYFSNQRVDPSANYTYDPVYRLIVATGREHLGQVGGAPIPNSYNDAPRVGLPHPNDGNAMGLYQEQYQYDAVGNILTMKHVGSSPANPGWTRAYVYGDASLIEPTKQSNRLSRTTIGTTTENYSIDGAGYDAHGNMLQMPQLQVMQWNYKDELQMTQRQAVNDTDTDGKAHQGERTWYVYGASGERVRKITEAPTGDIKEERVYFGATEVYRVQGANPFVRETLHIMDQRRRVALIETLTTAVDAGTSPPLIRYQFGNHLGSATLELDDQAQIVSYEEYTPYGSTSYQGVRSQTETAKRYRYSNKERDEESGLYYYGARYFAPWLGTWASPDPAGLADGLVLYAFCRSSPIGKIDSDGRSSETQEERDLTAASQLGQGSRSLARGLAPTTGSAMSFEYSRSTASFKLDGDLLSGTYNLWSGSEGKEAAKAAPGYIMGQTPEHLGAEAGVNDIKTSTGFLTVADSEFRSKWEPASEQIAARAAAAGSPVATYGNAAPESIQLRVERPTIQRAGTLSGALSIASGVANVEAGLKSDNPIVKSAAVAGGGAEIAGGIAYLAGAAKVGTDAGTQLMKVGGDISRVGGGVAATAVSGYALLGDIQRGDTVRGIGDAAGTATGLLTLAGATTTAALTGSFSAGYALGGIINDHVLSDEIKDAIGGTVNEIVSEGGWKHPFGIGW